MRGRSFNDPVALNLVRRRENVQWLTPILRATCATQFRLHACLKPDYVALTSCCGTFPFKNFTHLTMEFGYCLQADYFVHAFLD